MIELHALRARIDEAISRGLLEASEFGRPADEAALRALETRLGVPLPEDFRAFCAEIARSAPCPFVPVDDALFETELDEHLGAREAIDLLEGYAPDEPPPGGPRPFPLTKRWLQEIPDRAFGDAIVTHGDTADFVRTTRLPELPEGACPMDGLYGLWGHLHHCDTWCIDYSLVVHGEARGQIWALWRRYWPQGVMLLKPVAPSFVAWYTRWLDADIVREADA
jgi:hypothetical protein